ncbi:MAG: ATP-grasp domain-containing protein [Rhodobacteraceae bacterium]|nr:ATP-grasp domain-containing protein [Paracoccaceae bacterium]
MEHHQSAPASLPPKTLAHQGDGPGLTGVQGLVEDTEIRSHAKYLKGLDVDQYIEEIVAPSESKSRVTAQAIVRLSERLVSEFAQGPLYSAEIELQFDGVSRRIGLICQDRRHDRGVWKPEHHRKAARIVRQMVKNRMPIVTLIDTPGADASEAANTENQAHSISELIAEMTAAPVPTLGIVFGTGYSGGAIPLAACNLLLSTRDGIFSTIQPQGLASIARKYNLSWQECAKYVGISSYELYCSGIVDGIVDYVPGEDESKLDNLVNAIVTGIQHIEDQVEEHLKSTTSLQDSYKDTLDRPLHPSSILQALQAKSPSLADASLKTQANLFGIACRDHRFLHMHGKIAATPKVQGDTDNNVIIPTGTLKEREQRQGDLRFRAWFEAQDRLIYETDLYELWNDFCRKAVAKADQRGKLGRFLYGTPMQKYTNAKQAFVFNAGLFLYNRWKGDACFNFRQFIKILEQKTADEGDQGFGDPKAITIAESISHPIVRADIIEACKNMLTFDALYNEVIGNLSAIAHEAKESHKLTKNVIATLLNTALAGATGENTERESRLRSFDEWLMLFAKSPKRGEFLEAVEEWKRLIFPRISDTLFVIVTFCFENLFPAYLQSELSGEKYEGKINPAKIGRRKDFWYRLNIAYDDLLLRKLLDDVKQRKTMRVDALLERFVTDFSEIDSEKTSTDPVRFPGFQSSLDKANQSGITPCGVITGTGMMEIGSQIREVGLVMSNIDFQAGAFDMASAEKFCDLLDLCAARKLPVVCFISSGGMQTKEGAAALFSMAVVNERLTRFIADDEFPVIVFGFGDCTGGAQASFVTHPLVQTYYVSGTNMPFAGLIVVPSYLPVTATLSNYLSKDVGAMQGLVSHPFISDLDKQLQALDSDIPLADQTIETVLERELSGTAPLEVKATSVGPVAVEKEKIFRPIDKLLIYARGCTAMKLILKAHEYGLNVTLIASDPDMKAAPAKSLAPEDDLVCIGGNTPTESYLNANSVIAIARLKGVDALHPGIGFLSENPDFARLCADNNINFVGPNIQAIEALGNKSNAISAAIACGVPVIPGSHGPIPKSIDAGRIAKQVGYPVLLKAVHGGGGKGIHRVHDSQQLRKMFPQVVREARSAFGNGEIYVEKCIQSFRHVEVQFLRDHFGNTRVLGIRDCTIQRQNQKLVEESSSTLLSDALERQVHQFTEDLANNVEYIGAGTIEFIFDLAEQAVYFMEGNSRLQVEHPVTEAVTGVDIVRQQFVIAAGESIADLPVDPSGYAMEVRINAEKLVRQDGEILVVPSPGIITDCSMPADENIEVISIAGSGLEVTPFYDSLIMQIIAHGKDRKDTAKILAEYLDGVEIKGISTNIPMIRKILEDDVFLSGDYDQTFFPDFLNRIDVDQVIKDITTAAGQGKSKTGLDDLLIPDTGEIRVPSPLSGIFYTASSPTEEPFVKVGDEIDIDRPICLLEAMKVFSTVNLSSLNNSSQPVFSGSTRYRITRINVGDGQLVSQNDTLFIVKPLQDDPKAG